MLRINADKSVGIISTRLCKDPTFVGSKDNKNLLEPKWKKLLMILGAKVKTQCKILGSII